jgi:hypothetical protein
MECLNTYYIACYFYIQYQLQVQFKTLDASTSIKVSVKDVFNPT